MRSNATLAFLPLLFLLAVGCDDDPVEPEPDLPAADGAELAEYLEDEDYQTTFSLWPGPVSGTRDRSRTGCS